MECLVIGCGRRATVLLTASLAACSLHGLKFVLLNSARYLGERPAAKRPDALREANREPLEAVEARMSVLANGVIPSSGQPWSGPDRMPRRLDGVRCRCGKGFRSQRHLACHRNVIKRWGGEAEAARHVEATA